MDCTRCCSGAMGGRLIATPLRAAHSPDPLSLDTQQMSCSEAVPKAMQSCYTPRSALCICNAEVLHGAIAECE